MLGIKVLAVLHEISIILLTFKESIKQRNHTGIEWT